MGELQQAQRWLLALEAVHTAAIDCYQRYALTDSGYSGLDKHKEAQPMHWTDLLPLRTQLRRRHRF